MTTQGQDRRVVMRFEPSEKFSELCGFPYFIECQFTIKELIEQDVIDIDDAKQIMRGVEICKNLRFAQT